MSFCQLHDFRSGDDNRLHAGRHCQNSHSEYENCGRKTWIQGIYCRFCLKSLILGCLLINGLILLRFHTFKRMSWLEWSAMKAFSVCGKVSLRTTLDWDHTLWLLLSFWNKWTQRTNNLQPLELNPVWFLWSSNVVFLHLRSPTLFDFAQSNFQSIDKKKKKYFANSMTSKDKFGLLSFSFFFLLCSTTSQSVHRSICCCLKKRHKEN